MSERLKVAMDAVGFVRSSRPSRGELTPFCACGSAVLFEDVAAVEVTIEVEVIVDRGVGGGELLEGFHVPELRHRFLVAGTAGVNSQPDC